MRLSEQEQRVCAAVDAHAGDMLDRLSRCVAIPTGHNFKAGLDEYRGILLERLDALEARVRLIPGDPRPDWLDLPGRQATPADIPPTAIAESSGSNGAGTPRILIAGHLDTVHDPHGAFRTLSISADRRTAIGPGAVDMKGGIEIAVTALEALAECGVSARWSFLLNSDEETGSFHSYNALREAAKRHDVGLVLEPALPDGSLVVQRMGSGQFQVETFGRAAHVGRDFARGVSAVKALAETILRLHALNRDDGRAIVNIGPLLGGGVTNAVPDHAACWGNVRFSDPDVATSLGEGFDAVATDAGAMPRVVMHRAFNRGAKTLTPPVRRLAEMIRGVAQDLGEELPFASTGGVCDGNILQEAGLPTIDTLGALGGNLHRADEFIEIAGLARRARLFAVVMMRLGRNEGVAAI